MGAGRKLYLRGICPDSNCGRAARGFGDGRWSGASGAELVKGGAFELAFDLPDALAGRPEMEITVEVPRVIRPASYLRDFGLAFGVFEVK